MWTQLELPGIPPPPTIAQLVARHIVSQVAADIARFLVLAA